MHFQGFLGTILAIFLLPELPSFPPGRPAAQHGVSSLGQSATMQEQTDNVIKRVEKSKEEASSYYSVICHSLLIVNKIQYDSEIFLIWLH